ncbi:MAG: hypothetical protein BGO31_05370 [Bacteroidetes bacterium 43-16]|nr:MAG: hypothetical protein BGO31_05370 [Bacteroidetes bacterium 43-16]
MNDAAQETYNTWNKIGDLYQEKFMHLDLYNESYDLFCSYIKASPAHVLEIGCGPGNICNYLSGQRPDLKILGTDFAPNMVALAQKNNPQADFKVLDARKIKELDQKFEAIISGFCLPYLSPEEVKSLLEDTKTMLQPGGIIYLSFVAGKPEQSGMVTGSTGDRLYFYYHPAEDLIHLLKGNGFRVLKQIEVDYQRQQDQKETHSILIAVAAD